MKIKGIERAADEVRKLVAELPEGLESVLTNAIRSSRPYPPHEIKIVECKYVNNEVLFYKAHRDREYDPDYVLKDSDVYIEWKERIGIARGVRVSVFSDGTPPFVFWKTLQTF
jgi:hypothetical protein